MSLQVIASLRFIDPVVISWTNQVLTNGGPQPGLLTQELLSEFVIGCKNDGIWTKMISVNCFVPDSLIAAITPLSQSTGNNPWTNNNFVASDLTKGSLKGNASNKYLDSGVIITGSIFSSTNVGLTLYTATASSAGFDCLSDNSGGANSFGLLANLGGTSFFDCFSNTTGRITGTSQGAGYYSANRTGSNGTAIYYAKSSTAHAAIANGSNAIGGTFPNQTMMLFGENLGGSFFATNASNVGLSFVAFHSGLTSTDSANLFNRVQTLRQGFGGGYV